MNILKIEELEKSLKQGILGSLYLLYGEEKYLINNCVKNIEKLFGEKIAGINFVLIDENNVNEIISDIQSINPHTTPLHIIKSALLSWATNNPIKDTNTIAFL